MNTSSACGRLLARCSRTFGLTAQKASSTPTRSSHWSTARSSRDRLGAEASAAYLGGGVAGLATVRNRGGVVVGGAWGCKAKGRLRAGGGAGGRVRAGACGVLEQRPLQPPRVVCLHQPLTLRPTHLEGGGLVSKRPVRIATTLCRVRGATPSYRWLSYLPTTHVLTSKGV